MGVNPQSPNAWEANTANTMTRSLRESLTPEMWWAIKYRMGALLFCGISIIAVGAIQGWLGFAVLIASAGIFLDSAYWTWYVKRGIDRRFERERNARIYAESRANGAFGAPPENLLGQTTRQPARGFGGAPAIPSPEPKDIPYRRED